MLLWGLTAVLLGDLLVLVVPHHHRHRRADDVTHYLGRLAVSELLRRANVPEGQPLCGEDRASEVSLEAGRMCLP